MSSYLDLIRKHNNEYINSFQEHEETIFDMIDEIDYYDDKHYDLILEIYHSVFHDLMNIINYSCEIVDWELRILVARAF